jgi:peptidyl-prolyl cis-trans isomerase D
MATLQKIRNKAGVLVAVVIGLALMAFIMGDLLNSGPSVFSGNKMEVAEINGTSINYLDYNTKIEQLSDFYRANYQITSLDQETMNNIREEIWRTTVREEILGKAYNDLGINVSVEELKIMLMGDSVNAGGYNILNEEPHPIVRRMFTNPETGEFNRFQMMNYFNVISDEVYKDERKRWVYLENQIVDERLSQKYFTLLRKGFHPNSLDAKYFAVESGSTVDFNFVYQSFNTIPDDQVEASESDIKAYYEEHKSSFKQEEGRSIEYAIFVISPSEADDNMAHDFINQSKIAFTRSDNPISFINTNSDLPYKDRNYSKSELPEALQDSIFNAKPGFVTGTYFENGSYKMARLIGFNQVSDSVRARHILISLSVQRDDQRAKEIADSLASAITKGSSFFQLAKDFSSDESNREIGGDLGWFGEGAMVKPFSDACFNHNKGDIFVVKTNFGYHVVKLEDVSPKVKKAKIAFLERQVTPSDETYQSIYSQAVEFRTKSTTIEKFREECQKNNITPRFATDIEKNATSLPGLENSREIIRWAYENEENSVSQIFDLNDRYIVAALTDVKEKGIAPLDDVKTEIQIAVLKDKKLDILAKNINEKISDIQNLDDVAEATDSEIKEALKVRFSNPYVNGVGQEPNVVANAFSMEPGSLSKAIKGENGVFVIAITNKLPIEEPDIASAEIRLKYGIESRVSFEGYEALQKAAKIEDNRIKFY